MNIVLWIIVGIAAVIFGWLWWDTRVPGRRALRKKARKAIRRSEKDKTNGGGGN